MQRLRWYWYSPRLYHCQQAITTGVTCHVPSLECHVPPVPRLPTPVVRMGLTSRYVGSRTVQPIHSYPPPATTTVIRLRLPVRRKLWVEKKRWRVRRRSRRWNVRKNNWSSSPVTCKMCSGTTWIVPQYSVVWASWRMQSREIPKKGSELGIQIFHQPAYWETRRI